MTQHDPSALQAMTKAIKWALLALLALAVYYIGSQSNMRPAHQRPPATLSEAGKQIELMQFSDKQFLETIQASEKPLLLFIYTSWCPYCRKELPLFNEAAVSGDMTYLAVSIDQDAAAIANYLAEQQPLHFAPHTINDPYEQQAFIETLQEQGLNFKGPIPYLAVFHKGKPIAEVQGALEKADFDSMLRDVRAATSAETTAN